MSASTQPTTEADHPLKLAILAPRFWPYSGTDELALCDLAQTIADRGHRVEVITPGWSNDSPASFRFRNFDVLRIYRSNSAPWGRYRYQKNLVRYLNQTAVDGLVFFNAYHEFTNLAKNFAGKTSLIVRLHDRELASPLGQAKIKNRQANLLKLADRILVESKAAARALHTAGLPEKNITIAREGILPFAPPPSELSSQAVARQAIGEAHGMLVVHPNQPLLVCGAQMDGDKGMLDLVQAWKFVVRQVPSAKLWIVGQGTRSRKVWDAIVSKQLIDSIIMPGQFDNFGDVFRAADAYIHPLRGSSACSMLTRAMMASLCPVVTEPTATAINLSDGSQAHVAAASNPENLARVILKTIHQSNQRTQIGLAAADWAHDRFHISQTVKHYLDQFLTAPLTSL